MNLALFNLEKWLFIPTEQFDDLIDMLNISLTKANPEYMIGYILIHLYIIGIAIIVIYFVFKGINYLLGGRVANDLFK